MKYLLFNLSAVECIAGKTEFQSMEFPLGQDFFECVCGRKSFSSLDDVCIVKCGEKGLLFSGKDCDIKNILVFDLEQSGLLTKEKNMDDLLLVFQKSFRTAIRIWKKYPFASSERISGSKSILFPFVYTDRRRIVIERSAYVERLKRRGIEWPLLAYKYGSDAAKGEEIPDLSVLKDAGSTYLEKLSVIRAFFRERSTGQEESGVDSPLICAQANRRVSNGGFRYLPYDQQLQNLTMTQRIVVENKSLDSPIHIEGPAGTGKTVSMILRAYHLLCEAKDQGKPFKIVFFSHNESTNAEAYTAFSMLEHAEDFMDEGAQSILFISLFQYCVKKAALNQEI